eukprot:TRINITY_DN1742_c0_g1_i1.p1 TRINITY_DN1742_c0_g1~~TRINITY_DN1742_c0_g1_i1.p1  ORF type:complete len:170 (+),score=5.94 TRINITY_DN1742_c0_g1_i1:37-546(+)
MGFIGECFEGLLEGHESPGFRTFYRLFMFCFIVFTIVASILPVTSNDGAVMLAMLHMATVFIMLGMTFILIRWYRVDAMHAKFRRMIYVLIALIITLDIVAVADYVDSSKSPPPAPTPVPMTPTPCPPVPCVLTHNTSCFPIDQKCYSVPIAICGQPPPNATSTEIGVW